MNMNKKIIKGAVATVATVTILTTASMHIASAAKTTNEMARSTNTSIVQLAKEERTTGEEKAFKDETVYVFADETGANKKIIVSDWLKNKNGSSRLTDFSTLDEIKNVKGDETFDRKNGNEIQWNAQGSDIYYQGNSEEEVPVQIKVTYTLDGKEITPKELLGKSGSLKVRYDYTNKLKEMVTINGAEEEMYIPFLMMTSCILPTEHFSNVEVTNGRLVSDGNKQVVVGLALPGVSESLRLGSNRINIPDYFEYTADVTDFSVGDSVSIGLTDVLSDIRLDENSTIEDIQKSLDDLTDATNSLVEGSDKLYDGVKTLQDKTGDFSSGITTLVEGLNAFQDGTKSVATGANDVNKGVATVKAGTSSLVDGLSQAKSGADKLVSNYANLKEGANKIKDGLASSEGGIATLKGGIDNTNKTYETLEQTVTNDEQIIATLKQINEGYKDPNIEGVIANLEANTEGQKKIATGLTSAGEQLADGVGNLSTGVTSLSKGMGDVVSGVNALDTGSIQLQGALGQLVTGGKKLQSGVEQLAIGTDTLKKGTDKLHSSSGDLITGGNKLLDASKKLTTGVNDLTDGAYDLKEGMITYKEEGIQKLTESDLTSFIDRFNAISKLGEEYKTFTSLGDDMDGEVKFVIKMDGIED